MECHVTELRKCRSSVRAGILGFPHGLVHANRDQPTTYSSLISVAACAHATSSRQRKGIRMRYQWVLLCVVATMVGCKAPGMHNLPPAEMLMHPGPGVDGPGPGVIPPDPGMGPGGGMGMGIGAPTTQVYFHNPDGMVVTWDVSSPGMFDSEPITVPGRSNFPQGALYRLKLTNIPGRPGVELYPTIEIAPTMPRTEAYLAHNALQIDYTEEDFDQVLSGNFVTKVLFLPDPEFQELAVPGVETLVSTRLDPGLDPIVEADRRGSILGIVRLGNKDLQVPGAEDQGAIGMYGGSFGAGGMGDCESGMCCAGGGPGLGPSDPSAMISGLTGPQYGMPISGTPIGLPGPPHVPLGVPAGLKKHVIANHTHVHLPKPTHKVRIDVKQSPGMNYPKPPSHVHIHERSFNSPVMLHPPHNDKRQMVH